MLPKTFSQKGQALILIVLAIVGMIGLVALAIDGGNAFSDRRHAQNAADTAALAAALAKIKAERQDPPLTPEEIQIALQNAAIDRANSNGYPVSTVTVNNPTQTGCGGSTNPYIPDLSDSWVEQELKKEYVQVIIYSTVNTYFAPVVGITELHNCVEAIARAKPAEPVSLCYGALICGLSPTDKNTLRTFGGANITLDEGPAFSNSDHDTQALYVANSDSLQIKPPYGVMAVGGFKVPPLYIYIPTGELIPKIHKVQLPYPLPQVMMPKQKYDWTASDCDYNDYHDLPQDLPASWTHPDGKIYLHTGVYCVTGNFNKAAYRNETDGIGGVTIVMLNEGLSWTGNTDIILNAPPDCSLDPVPCPNPPPTAGLLVYLPYGNQNKTVKFAGTGHLEMIGSILALDINSMVQYNGTYDTGVFRSQLVGWTFEFGGDAEGHVLWPPYSYKWPGIPIVELVK